MGKRVVESGRRVSVYVEDDDIRILKAIIYSKGLTISGWMRSMIDAYIKKNGKIVDSLPKMKEMPKPLIDVIDTEDVDEVEFACESEIQE